MAITLQKITYKDLRERTYKRFDDRYGILAFMTERLRETMLACPNNEDELKTAMYIMTDENVAVGRVLQFGTKLKLGETIISAGTGGSMFVEEGYRSKGVGADLLMAMKMSKEYDVKIFSLFSQMVVPMYKKMRYTFYDIPQFAFLNNSGPILASKGLHGLSLEICGFFLNLPMMPIIWLNKRRLKKLYKEYVVRKETVIPKWVETMIMNNSYKYMELHNREWLQWNLDYNMNGFSEDKQAFYAVYDKSGAPKAFFMTKERFEKKAGHYRNVIRGTIVEWETIDKKELNEADLNLMAIQTFSPQTFLIHTVTTDNLTMKRLKKRGFVRHGLLQMNIFERQKHTDIADISLWRIRYGCCNTIIFGES